MKRPDALLWKSISILIGAVIAVLALVRGTWQLPLLLICIGAWVLWLLFAQLFPAWSSIRKLSRKEEQARRKLNAMSDANITDAAMAQKLLHHINFRISGYLKSAYPEARWEWCVSQPEIFAIRGGTARIRVYGIPDYEYADVTLDQKDAISCSLVKVFPLYDGDQEQPAPPNEQIADPQVWYELEGQVVLEGLVADLNSRGHSKLYLKENGSIFVKTEDDQEEIVQASFRSFPEKVYWPRLKDVLEQAGLAATVADDYIQVAW